MTMQAEDLNPCRSIQNPAIDPLAAQKRECWYWRQSREAEAMRATIKTILLYPRNFRWTVQGFGMLRTYLPFGPNGKRFRLNVWNADLAVPNVSTMHDHPWSFNSWIINGRFANVRFVEHENGCDYAYMLIKCGEFGGALDNKMRTIRLRELPVEHYNTGDKYRQEASEIHLSAFANGTVTLNDRTGDTEQARVFWPAGQQWVDAKPREATAEEISDTVFLALGRWEDEISH